MRDRLNYVVLANWLRALDLRRSEDGEHMAIRNDDLVGDQGDLSQRYVI